MLNLRVSLRSVTCLESCSLYDPKVLKLLFVKGYVQLVLKIIVQLAKTLDQNSSSQQVPEFLDLDLA